MIPPVPAQSTMQIFEMAPTEPDWSNFWSKFRMYVEWSFERDEGNGWVKSQGLKIIRAYPQPNTCKIRLIFNAPSKADYRLTVALKKKVLKYISKVEQFHYVLQYNEFKLVFDWSDLKEIPGLIFNHGILNNTFYWRVRRDNVPEGAHVDLDPTFQVSVNTDDCYVFEHGSTHPPWDYIQMATTALFCGYLTTQYWYYGIGLRFTNITIDQGIKISSAKLRFKASVSTSGTVNTKITGEDTDTSNTFSDVSDFNGRSRTGNTTQWSNVEPWSSGEWYESPDISNVIQEIIDRQDWNSGNNLTLFWEDNGGSSDRRACYAYENSATNAPQLIIVTGKPEDEQEETEIEPYYVPPEVKPPLEEIKEIVEPITTPISKHGLYIIIGVMAFLVIGGAISQTSRKKLVRTPRGPRKTKRPRGPTGRFKPIKTKRRRI